MRRGSGASKLYSRRLRYRIISCFVQMCHRYGLVLNLATLLSSVDHVQPGQLLEVRSRHLLQRFRSDMNYRGAKRASGGFFAAVDGEYDMEAECYHLHLHVLVWGEMIQVVERLRNARKYRPRSHSLAFGHEAMTPVKISPVAGPVGRVAGYLLKSQWPSVLSHQRADSRRVRSGRRVRLREPLHTEVLLWLDREPLDHRTLMMGMRIAPDGYHPA